MKVSQVFVSAALMLLNFTVPGAIAQDEVSMSALKEYCIRLDTNYDSTLVYILTLFFIIHSAVTVCW